MKKPTAAGRPGRTNQEETMTMRLTILILMVTLAGCGPSAESRKEAAKNYPVDYDEQVYNEEKAWGN